MLKSLLKKSKLIAKVYRGTMMKRNKVMSVICPKKLSKIQYRNIFNRELNLDDPVYLNEKLMWLKFNRYTGNPLVTKCIDKYSVRSYVRECGLENILNENYGVWEHVEDIDWDMLPNQFVLKGTHGCGLTMVCRDKDTLDIEKAKEELKHWLKTDTWKEYAETNYRDVPKRIICEKILEGEDGALPVDYKFYCFQGKPLYIGNFIERNLDEGTLVRGYYNLDWTPSHVFKYSDQMELDKFRRPINLDSMILYAETLSKPFPFVRVDLYEVQGKVVFGELTFTPTGCMGSYYAKEAYLELGNALDIHYNEK